MRDLRLRSGFGLKGEVGDRPCVGTLSYLFSEFLVVFLEFEHLLLLEEQLIILLPALFLRSVHLRIQLHNLHLFLY